MRLWRRREYPRLHYYLYVSDTKLDMLFEQIDQSTLKRISAEVKVDLKLASVTLKRADNPAPARAAKLRVVERFIDRHHQVGTIDDPGNEYFRGRMQMAWGWLRTPPVDDIVFFQGWQGHHTVVLAGSSRHVLGWAATEEETRWCRSSFPDHILWALDEHISNTSELADSIREAKYRNPQWWLETASSGDIKRALNESFFLHHERHHRLAQSLEFLAVPLIQEKGQMSRYPPGPADADNTILGTPLYVAIASGDTTEKPPLGHADHADPSTPESC